MAIRRSDAEPAAPPLRSAAIRIALVVFVAGSLAFAFRPALDLAISSAFIGAGGRFIGADSVALGAVMDAITVGSRAFSALLLIVTALCWLPWARRVAGAPRLRGPLLFILVVLALGPGLLVNTVLKEHSGRARPLTTTEFGGERRFSPAFVIADQCRSNCSFVSGHAAFATMPVVGAFLASTRRRRRAWLAAGFACGFAVGIGRIASGAHFASDVWVAVFAVYFVAAACAASLPKLLAGSGLSKTHRL
jgi:lipid A 4'-phosphatase